VHVAVKNNKGTRHFKTRNLFALREGMTSNLQGEIERCTIAGSFDDSDAVKQTRYPGDSLKFSSGG